MNKNEFVFIVSAEKSIVLHPFLLDRYSISTTKIFLGRCSVNFNPANADSIRKNLYFAAEQKVQKSIVDKNFTVKLLFTAAVFMIVYFFFSIVVRDPIPFIDEFLLASISAAFVYIYQGRRVKKSQKYLEAIMDSRKLIDSIYFTESPVLYLLEAWISEFKTSGAAVFHKPGDSFGQIKDEDRQEAIALCELLASRFRKRFVVADLYKAIVEGKAPGTFLKKTWKQLGDSEGALALAYLKLLSLTSLKNSLD